MSDRPWPENVWPTAEQWLDWLLTLPREEQLKQAKRNRWNAETAHTCFIANHDGLREQVNAQATFTSTVTRQANRYRLAWLSARHRANRAATAATEETAR